MSCGDLAGMVSLRLPVLVSFEGVEEYGTSYVVGAEQILKSDGKRSSAYATDKNGRGRRNRVQRPGLGRCGRGRRYGGDACVQQRCGVHHPGGWPRRWS